jgi:hypothetical protein
MSLDSDQIELELPTPLLRCPFCAGEAYLITGFVNFIDCEVHCSECGIQGPNFDEEVERDTIGETKRNSDTHLKNMASAIKHWNTRHK